MSVPLPPCPTPSDDFISALSRNQQAAHGQAAATLKKGDAADDGKMLRVPLYEPFVFGGSQSALS